MKVEVSWKPRINGVKPENTIFKTSELRKYNSELLLDFYES